MMTASMNILRIALIRVVAVASALQTFNSQREHRSSSHCRNSTSNIRKDREKRGRIWSTLWEEFQKLS
ncbi:hypothetical protein R69608_03250 [Paraburkholderia nemoris]|nr:hypothetical protein R69608_03250 [Paraburkholderia nemoris]